MWRCELKQGNHHEEGSGIERKLHDPVADKLIPLAPLDLTKITSIDGLFVRWPTPRLRAANWARRQTF